MLTHNRHETVNKAFEHNINNSGYKIDEIIWCDNESKNLKCFDLYWYADVAIVNSKNLGVAKGYNRALAMTTGDYIVITGCDRLMPSNWLKTWIDHIKIIPNTGVISCYSKDLSEVPERIMKQNFSIYGKNIIQAIPMEARIYSRKFHDECGYFREDFGLYGLEDVYWSHRAQKVAYLNDLINYTIPGMKAEHLGSEGVYPWNGTDDQAYHDFKVKELADPRKQLIMRFGQANQWPYYNPYSGQTEGPFL